MDRDENGARGIFLRALLDGALILSGDHAVVVVMPTIDMLQSIRTFCGKKRFESVLILISNLIISTR